MQIQVTKDKIYIVLATVAVLISGLVYYAFFMPNESLDEANIVLEVPMNEIVEKTEIKEEIKEKIKMPEYITVFISGEVENIGVFTLNQGSRIIDALYKAGGTTKLADLNRINLANFINDAEHIIIPSIYDNFTNDGIIQNNVIELESQNNLVNINTADSQMLQTLPGIGPVLAGNIIDHRNENGSFNSISEIQNVNRIGAGVFNNIRSLITIN